MMGQGVVYVMMASYVRARTQRVPHSSLTLLRPSFRPSAEYKHLYRICRQFSPHEFILVVLVSPALRLEKTVEDRVGMRDGERDVGTRRRRRSP